MRDGEEFPTYIEYDEFKHTISGDIPLSDVVNTQSYFIKISATDRYGEQAY